MPFPSPGDFPDPGIERMSLMSPALANGYTVRVCAFLIKDDFHRASLVAELVKNPPIIWETWVQSLGWEDPLEKGMTTHSSVLAWRIP